MSGVSPMSPPPRCHGVSVLVFQPLCRQRRCVTIMAPGSPCSHRWVAGVAVPRPPPLWLLSRGVPPIVATAPPWRRRCNAVVAASPPLWRWRRRFRAVAWPASSRPRRFGPGIAGAPPSRRRCRCGPVAAVSARCHRGSASPQRRRCGSGGAVAPPLWRPRRAMSAARALPCGRGAAGVMIRVCVASGLLRMPRASRPHVRASGPAALARPRAPPARSRLADLRKVSLFSRVSGITPLRLRSPWHDRWGHRAAADGVAASRVIETANGVAAA